MYPTRHQDGTLSVIVLNSGSDPHDVVFGFDALASGSEASVSSSIAVSPDALDMERVGPTALGRVDRSVRVTIAGWSINVIEVTAGE